ncbi:protoheme IX farnesyltransferase [Thermus thermophilus]|nr:protoheme IX farnesyltransferase [Thermus thermophilus]
MELGEGGAEVHRGTGGATWRDYLALTKPRVISLLLFTALFGALIAAKGWPGLGVFLAVALGGYMMAGAANAINMVVDRDIDARMKRTAKRPTVTQRVSSRDALLFAFALAVLGFAVLWWGANLLAATLALMGLIWYVLVYTLYLKRRTWHNIVIGGAAGAFPPLVGWAAVTGELSLFAWYLFALIFFWTPVHFWALALMIQDDYRAVGVPMLPVVLGERATVIQIALYALLTALISLMPLFLGELGLLYLAASLLLNALLLLKSLALYRRPERRTAVSLYKYSMLYLALLFAAMAVDRAV